jgi:myo-inositol-1(or 4)-monophosphatase
VPQQLSSGDIDERFTFACELAKEAGRVALAYFEDPDSLQVSDKGPQDLVSQADVETERLIRAAIADKFPADAFFGEETGASDFHDVPGIWVVDPIDGTQPFIMGMPNWCVSIAFIDAEFDLQIGVVYSPAGNEFFTARRGQGATLNDRPIHVRTATSLNDGIVSVGYSPRTSREDLLHMIDGLIAGGGMYWRNGSGTLGLCYVGCGRLIGYIEEHINAWDCLAAMLVIQEAGGLTSDFIADNGLAHGGPLVAGSPGIFTKLQAIMPRAQS